ARMDACRNEGQASTRRRPRYARRRRRAAMLRLSLSLFLLLAGATALAADTWVEGKHYFRIEPAEPYAPQEGKVEVTEVFSYACPACFRFHPFVDRLAARLPSNPRPPVPPRSL